MFILRHTRIHRIFNVKRFTVIIWKLAGSKKRGNRKEIRSNQDLASVHLLWQQLLVLLIPFIHACPLMLKPCSPLIALPFLPALHSRKTSRSGERPFYTPGSSAADSAKGSWFVVRHERNKGFFPHFEEMNHYTFTTHN